LFFFEQGDLVGHAPHDRIQPDGDVKDILRRDLANDVAMHNSIAIPVEGLKVGERRFVHDARLQGELEYCSFVNDGTSVGLVEQWVPQLGSGRVELVLQNQSHAQEAIDQ
jgi:hypothetical protein